MSRMEQTEYTLDSLQCMKEFFGKWYLWLFISIVAGVGITMANYRTQSGKYAEYEARLADYQEVIMDAAEQKQELVDPEVAKEQLSVSEVDAVENALILYEVVQQRKDYRDHSALNQLDANNAKLLTLSYRIVSTNSSVDIERLHKFFLSEDFYAVVADTVEQYRKEYISEILSVSVTGAQVVLKIWLPEDSFEKEVQSAINSSVQQYWDDQGLNREIEDVVLEESEVNHIAYMAVTNNIQGSTGNYINAQAALDNFLAGMSDNALAVYYAEFGEAYYVQTEDPQDTDKVEMPEVVERPSFNLLLAFGGLVAGLALCLFGFICVQIFYGKIYSQAVGRSMGFDYSADLWIKEKAYGKEAERSSFDCVSENVNELGTARGICFVEVGETRAEMQSIISELEESVDQLISLDRMQILEQPVLTVADAIGSRETEIILLADVKRVRYGRLARVVYELRNLGFARISCICLH